MRPDVLLRAEAPNIRALMKRGSFTFYAQSTDLAITLPTHTSMLTGLEPNVHGIKINDDSGDNAKIELTRPTLLTLTKAAGRTTAMVAAKSKFSLFAKGDTLDWAYYPTDEKDPNGKPIKTFKDAQIGERAVSFLAEHSPQVLFVHFPGPDSIGHAAGWGSDKQLAAVTEIDGWIGKIVAEVERQGQTDKTLILLTADHGGAIKSHGGLDARSRLIPFIAAGPGVRENYDLTQVDKLVVRVEDTMATGLEWLEVARPAGILGQPVWAIYTVPPQGAPTAAPKPAPKPATAPAYSGS
jgi:predicted AlkP superfamily pyrophosphatase or phosphodiesterase